MERRASPRTGPMGGRSAVAVLVVILLVVPAIPGVFDLRANAIEVSETASARGHPLAPVTTLSERNSLFPPGVNHSIQGPFGGRYYNTSVTPPYGLASSAQVDVDNKTHVVYSLNFGGTITAYGEFNSTLLAMAYLPWTASGGAGTLALDPVHHELVVSFISSPAKFGWLLIYNETTLQQVRTVSAWPGALAFQPGLLVFDQTSLEMFVSNLSGQYIAVVNTTDATEHALVACLLPCDVFVSRIALQTGPGRPIVVVTGGSGYWAINTSTNLANGAVVPAPLSASMLLITYDSVDRLLYVVNGSSRQIFRYGPSGGYVDTISGAANTSALGYDPVTNTVVFTTTTLPTDIWSLGGASGSVRAHHSGTNFQAAFTSLSIDGPAGQVLTGGSLGSTNLAFTLPSLAVVRQYPGFGYDEGLLTVDPLLGYAYFRTFDPTQITAVREASGQAIWNSSPSKFPNPATGLAVDPGMGRLYASDESRGVVEVASAVTGAWIANVSLGPTALPTTLAVDGTNHLLYVAEVGPAPAVTVLSTTSDNVLGTIALPGATIRGLAVDPVRNVGYVTSSQSFDLPGNVTTLYSQNFSKGPVFATGNSPYSMAVNSSGFLFVGNFASNSTSVIDPTGLFSTRNISSAPLGPLGETLEATGSTLYVLGYSALQGYEVQIFNTSSRALVGSLPLPPTFVQQPAFDPSSSTLIVPVTGSGQLFFAQELFRPSAPTALAAGAGNTTIVGHWAAPASGSWPVLGYNVSLGTSATGPWSPVATVAGLSRVVAGLTDGTPYYVAVAAYSGLGTGPLAVSPATVPVGVPFPPVSVTVVPNGSSALVVLWAAPASTGGAAITNYTVEYRATGATGWRTSSAGTQLILALHGLSPDSTYSVIVVAWNSAGSSNPSGQVSGRTASSPEGPSPPSALSDPWVIVLSVVAAAVGGLLVGRWSRRAGPPGRRSGLDPTGLPDPGPVSPPPPPGAIG